MILHRHRRAQPKSSSDTEREHRTSVVEPRATRQIGISAVPAEAAAQETLHGALYLSYPDMADLHAERGLTRAQMEFVAARVSYLNDCLF